MKKIYTGSFCKSIYSLSLSLACCVFASQTGYGQTFYSKFEDPAGKYYTINAGGDNCTAPGVMNSIGFVDMSESTYASFTITNRTDSFECDPYHFVANLNVPADTPMLDPGYKAGVRIRVPSGITLDSLRKYLVISSYTNTGSLVESKYNEDILGIDSMMNGKDWFVYFIATKPFNTVELNVYPNIAPLNTNFEFDVLYALGSMDAVLPAQIANFTLSATGSNVALSWQSLTETNVANYRIERSSDGGSSYTTAATVGAKGNSNVTTSYGYTDVVTAGTYLYRVVTVNRDGSSKTTNSLTAVIKGNAQMILYPSLVRAGQNVTIKTSDMGLVTVLMYSAQGKLVKQQRYNSGGTLTVSTSGFSAGIYVVKVISADGNVLSSKIMVN